LEGNVETFSLNSSPVVSIIMPVFNGARTLKDAVDSILAQTFNDFEFIICNDGSTDDTEFFLNGIVDERVHVLQNKENIGEGFARDRAIESAKGEWLAFIDADDVWASERLETLLGETDTSMNRMIFDDILQCHDTAHGMVPWRALRGKYAFGGNGIDSVEVALEKYVCQEHLLMQPLLPLWYVRKYHVRHGARRFAADTEFIIQLLFHGLKLYWVPKPMYYYRITPNSMAGLNSRYIMMREVIENAIKIFEHDPPVQAALYKKIALVTRDEQYMPFVWALKKKQLRNAYKLAYLKPWVVSEFFKRFAGSLRYHVHRILHGGRSRGIR
jgi:glycosyltransferase involved in cell wall biosynthesis